MSLLAHAVSGDARCPTVLFLHGFMGSSRDWRGVVSALEARFRCISVDLPGHGASLGLLPEVYTIEGAARALLEVLDELGIGRTAIVGYSMGGRLALYLALRYPKRCAGLFLESASPGIENAAQREARRRSDELKAARLESGDIETFLLDWYRQPLFASLAPNEGLLRETIGARLQNDPQELARALREMGTGKQPSLWRELPGLRAPTLAVAGELDEKYVRVSRLMADSSPRMSAAVISGAGHSAHAEAPGRYLDLLSRFLSGLRRG